MSALLSTTLIAVAAIAAATVAVCFHVVSSTEWVSIVGAFGGGTGVLHVTSAAAVKPGA